MGQPGEAAWLQGAAETLRAEIRAPLSPVEQPEQASTERAARAALGEAAFEAARAAGRALTLEEAVTKALA
jgi:hypothetical protein